jgi:hypothetical protein
MNPAQIVLCFPTENSCDSNAFMMKDALIALRSQWLPDSLIEPLVCDQVPCGGFFEMSLRNYLNCKKTETMGHLNHCDDDENGSLDSTLLQCSSRDELRCYAENESTNLCIAKSVLGEALLDIPFLLHQNSLTSGKWLKLLAEFESSLRNGKLVTIDAQSGKLNAMPTGECRTPLVILRGKSEIKKVTSGVTDRKNDDVTTKNNSVISTVGDLETEMTSLTLGSSNQDDMKSVAEVESFYVKMRLVLNVMELTERLLNIDGCLHVKSGMAIKSKTEKTELEDLELDETANVC